VGLEIQNSNQISLLYFNNTPVGKIISFEKRSQSLNQDLSLSLEMKEPKILVIFKVSKVLERKSIRPSLINLKIYPLIRLSFFPPKEWFRLNFFFNSTQTLQIVSLRLETCALFPFSKKISLFPPKYSSLKVWSQIFSKWGEVEIFIWGILKNSQSSL